MSDAMDMSMPVTRGELREELALLEQKFDQKLTQFATKRELELWGGALLARMGSFEQRLGSFEQRLGSFEQRLESFGQRLESFGQRLLADLAQHTKAISESLSAQISIMDDKYADLPARVGRLEVEVFPPTQR